MVVLDGHGLEWFVFGAQAVAVRGAPRASQDVDITVNVKRTEVADLIAALEREGIRHRHPEIASLLLTSGSVLPLVHESGMEIDLVIASSGLEAIALERATRLSIDGVAVPVAHATDLVVMRCSQDEGKT